MTLPALANLRCPPRSVSRTEPTGTRLHGPSVSGSDAVTPLMRAGFHGSHPGSAGALAGPTRSIARNIRSRLSVAAQAWEVSPACNEGNAAGEGAGAPRDANGPRTTIYPCSDARTPAIKYRPCLSGTCPGSMELTPGRDKEGDIASPVVFTLPRHGPGECRSAHPRSLPRHRSR